MTHTKDKTIDKKGYIQIQEKIQADITHTYTNTDTYTLLLISSLFSSKTNEQEEIKQPKHQARNYLLHFNP